MLSQCADPRRLEVAEVDSVVYVPLRVIIGVSCGNRKSKHEVQAVDGAFFSVAFGGLPWSIKAVELSSPRKATKGHGEPESKAD
jgi:hypothetical protein